jgi:hypothetical protein
MAKYAFTPTVLGRVPEVGEEVTVSWRIPLLDRDGRPVLDKYGRPDYGYEDDEMTVTDRSFYGDNSIVVFGNLHSTGERTQIEVRPPSGDACF